MQRESHTTTPFGRRPLTLAQIAAQASARDRPPEAAAHKWMVFRALCAAKQRLGLTERALAVLDALLSFHPETALTGDDLVVYPSNTQLSLRAHGMAPATLRRHLAVLVEAGVVLRRDSPNGKRYARKGREGTVAFGFDLAPLVARAAEFEALAEETREEARALRVARERFTLLRRDVAKMIAAGAEEGAEPPPGAPATWAQAHARFRHLVESVPRAAGRTEVEAAVTGLAALASEVGKALEAHAKSKIPSANESHAERHLQNSNPDSHPDLEPAFKKSGAEAAPPRQKTALPLGFVLKTCPDIADYARSGVGDWRDLAAAASVARAALGVSPSAFAAAQAAMGERDAAIAVAAILQKGGAITSPGGYLRELTRKAERNAFSVAPMLLALAAGRAGATPKVLSKSDRPKNEH